MIKNDNSRLINCYDKKTELIVDINAITFITTITDIKSYVHSLLLLSDGRLASCSDDNGIRIYNIKNDYHCDFILEGHTDYVTYISQLDNNKLISCSSDKAIKIWSITQSSYQCDYTIKNAHTSNLFKLISLTNNRMASISYDKTIKI